MAGIQLTIYPFGIELSIYLHLPFGGYVIKTIATATVCALLGACASTAPGGRSQLVAPNPVSSVYSAIDMNLRLATTPENTTACAGDQCQVDQAFERQVNRLGARLAKSAYEIHPDLKERGVADFKFFVAEKSEAGTASDSSGTIVVYRALRRPGLDEGVLAFLIAREMGHVIARHHDEKSAASMIASAVVAVLLPITNLAGAAAFLAGSAASTAGANVIAPDGDPGKTGEATAIALGLLAGQGWRSAEVGGALVSYAGALGDSEWKQSIQHSLAAFPPPDPPRQMLALEHSPPPVEVEPSKRDGRKTSRAAKRKPARGEPKPRERVMVDTRMVIRTGSRSM